MGHTDTPTRILNTAELLFAQHGFTETSLRAITRTAGVNLAAVNYHFGSKEGLIQAVFERYLTPFCRALDARLDEFENAGDVSLERLLALVSPLALGGQGEQSHRAMVFFRLSGQAYSQPQDHLRVWLRRHYGDVFRHFLDLLHAAVPEVSPMELFLRVHFGLGAVIFALSGMESLQAIGEQDFRQNISAAQITDRLLPFVMAGIKG